MSVPNWMQDSNDSVGSYQWTSCKIEDICSNSTGPVEWRIDPKNPEHMNNWIQKFNLICKPHQLKWMTPVMALGVILSLVIVPSVSDKFGRKNVYNSSLIISLFA